MISTLNQIYMWFYIYSINFHIRDPIYSSIEVVTTLPKGKATAKVTLRKMFQKYD